MNEDYLLWQSTIPMTGSIRFVQFSFIPIQEFKVMIKRFNEPDLIKTVSQKTVIRSSDMKALLVNIPTQEEPPELFVEFCLRDQADEQTKCTSLI